MSDKKYDIYIASPLFCDQDHAELDIIEAMLDEAGINYFSPRRDSALDLRGCKTGEERDAVAQQIFDLNHDAVHASRVVLVNTIGTPWNNAIYSDAGTMVEAGMAFALDIPVVTYNFKKFGLNIMLSQKSVYHCDNTTLEDHSELTKVLDVLNRIYDDPSITPQELRDEFFAVKDRELV